MPQTIQQVVIKLVQTGNDLTLRQLAVMICCRKAAATVRDVADTLQVSRSVISRIADRLADLNYIQRADDPGDRRSVLLELTAAGRKFVDALD